ncbi:MAG: AbrB/MazE/SpoVT family DNA-binding domain-containing protein [Spirochaetota bacterium]
MKIIIKKWGNSLGIRLPKYITAEYSLKDGTPVKIEKEEGKIIITPQKNGLSDLLDKINDSNLHKEIDTGEPIGKEIW